MDKKQVKSKLKSKHKSQTTAAMAEANNTNISIELSPVAKPETGAEGINSDLKSAVSPQKTN